MNTSSTKERRSLILSILETGEAISVTRLSQQLGISEVTIRKDLTELQRRNLVVRTRGGAIRVPKTAAGEDTKIEDKRLYNIREKQAIGRLAASLIHNGDTILLDSGTTTLEVAKNLDRLQQLTVITNSMDIALELLHYNRFTIILLGGHVRQTSHSSVGPLAEATLKNFYCDKLFLGIDSFNMEDGISTPNIEEAHLNQNMIDMSKEVIAVCDSSKFNRRSFAFIAPVSKLTAVVTDNAIERDIKLKLQDQGVQIYIADSGRHH